MSCTTGTLTANNIILNQYTGPPPGHSETKWVLKRQQEGSPVMSTLEMLNDHGLLNGAWRCPVTRDEAGCAMKCCPPKSGVSAESRSRCFWRAHAGGGMRFQMISGPKCCWYCRVFRMTAHTRSLAWEHSCLSSTWPSAYVFSGLRFCSTKDVPGCPERQEDAQLLAMSRTKLPP